MLGLYRIATVRLGDSVSFYSELKQRKVLRVAAVYLAAAWVATEVASVALPAFDAPSWVLRVIILVFALGFPVALLLAWALELTPEGIKTSNRSLGNKRMLTLVAGLTAIALGWFFIGKPALRGGDPQLEAASADIAAAATPVTQEQKRSIAVLPFVNMSGDKSNDYFSDGLAETTLDMLAQVKDLKVIARTSSFAFKGKATDVREIGKALGAAHLLEGSVQQSGDTVRITAQLVRTSDGTHLWSRRFDRKLADVFKIQDEIATEVVSALQIALPAAEEKQLLGNRTSNVAAYDEYLKGTALLPGRKVPELRRALAHFKTAIKLDPGFARAYAMAGTTIGLLKVWGEISDAEREQRAAYIDRALALAPDLGEAHIAKGAIYESVDKDYDAAEAEYRRGIALAPGYATGYQWLGELLMNYMGQVNQALPLLRHALSLDPLSPIIHRIYLMALMDTGNLDEAQVQLDSLLRAHPDFGPAYQTQSDLSRHRGDLVGALRAADAADRLLGPGAPFATGSRRCYLLVDFGARKEAGDCVAEYTRTHQGPMAEKIGGGMRMDLLMSDGKIEEVLASQPLPTEDPMLSAVLLFSAKRYEESARYLRQVFPELFSDPPDISSTSYLEDLMVVGYVRSSLGEQKAGQDLINQAIRQAAARPIGQARFTRRWNDVIGLSMLGRPAAACKALEVSVRAGVITGLGHLNTWPQLADLKTLPCYEHAIAPARAAAAAEVERARKAGLL